MGEVTDLEAAIASVIGLAQAQQQRQIVKRLREKVTAAEFLTTCGVSQQWHDGFVTALHQFVDELESELA